MGKVLVVMGSDSDLPVVAEAIKVLGEFAIEVDARVCSAHRTPYKAEALAKGAEAGGYDVIIAAAGKAAHLPGVLAAYTPLPVIGLPIKSSFMDGLDSLLSIVQMPDGIPVATVAVNGAVNAGLLAAQIISVKDGAVRSKILGYKEKMAAGVAAKDAGLQERLKEAL